MCFFRMFDAINNHWGQFIGLYPHTHIWLSFAVVALFSAHLANLNIEHDIRASFSPANSRATYENRVYKEFFNLSISPQRSFILFSAKDNGSMLRLDQLGDVQKLDQEFMSVLRQKDSTSGTNGCDPLCNLNAPFHMISQSLIKMYRGEASQDDKKELLLDYPTSIYHGNKLFVGMNMIGAQMTKNGELFAQNNSRIVSVKTVILWYFSRADTTELKSRLRKATLDLFESAQKGHRLQHVDFQIFGDEIANSEMVRGAIEATVLMSIGFALLLVFIAFTIYNKMSEMSKWAVLVVVFASVLCSFLASLAAFGMLTWLGFHTYTIMCVTPFLIAGVGVDDAFIMLQSWDQHKHIRCLKHRLCVVMVHVGPSITITSLTNTVAFGIGYATPTPQMSLFCLCTSIAVLFDYFLTFTLLAPTVLLVSPSHELPELPSEQQVDVADNKLMLKNISPAIHKYSAFLHSKKGRIVAFVLSVTLYVIATIGVANMKSTFEPSKAFPSDSPLASSMDGIREVFNEFFPINIFVNRPPNISDESDYALFNKMVSTLETIPESYGQNRTILWLRAFEVFDEQTSQLWNSIGLQASKNYTPTYENLDFFLQQLNYPPSIKMEVNEKGEKHLKAFQFTIIAKDMSEWSNRAIVEQKCREILERFPQFNASIYDGDSAVLNLLLTVKIDLIGSITVTVICMTIICSFFIPNQIGVAIIAFTISSICYTLVGLMSWWGADLDPVTIVDVLLATGFSVDYTAHVAHQFYTKTGRSTERIAISLHEMSAPMLQAGTSTVLCMLPLIFVPTYAIVAFAKTVFVVVAVGLLHGLFFMPVLLCLTPQEDSQLFKYCANSIGRKKKGPPATTQASIEPLITMPSVAHE